MTSSPSLPDAIHGFERKFIAVLLIVGWCSVSWAQSGLAQAKSSVRPPSQPSGSRMGVIESSASFERSSVYTVVGAVQQPGSYHSKEDTISLDQLLRAAGGLTSDASPSLRIIRNGQLRFQVTYDSNNPNSANRLIPGDIVVAISPPTMSAASAVPVACVGISPHTVVLPLDPAIRNVNELAARLGQSVEVARAARVISPVGDAHGRLYPGTVVIFPVSLVDRLPLRQPGFLPPTLDLKDFVNPASQSADASAFLIGDQAERGGQDQVQAPLPVSHSMAAPLGLTVPDDDSSSAPATPLPASPMVSQLESPSLLQAAPTLTAIDSEHDGGAPSIHLFRQPPVDGIAPGKVTSTAGVANGFGDRSPLVFADERSQFDATQSHRSEMNETIEEHRDSRLDFPATVPPNNLAILPIVRKPSFPNQIPIDHVEDASVNHSDVTSEDKPASSSLSWKFVFGIALTLSGAFGGVWYWATFRGGQLSGITVSNLIQGLKTPTSEQSNGTSVESAIETRQESSPAHSSGVVSDIVERRIPMVEERVVIPCQWPLQGNAQGFRRLILNAPHASVSGPHFNVAAVSEKSDSPRTSVRTLDERQLRRKLKAAIAELNSAMADRTGDLLESDDDIQPEVNSVSGGQVDAFVDVPVAEQLPPVITPNSISASFSPIHNEVKKPVEMGRKFDIVQPELPPPIAKSPLERALRTLASEKRG